MSTETRELIRELLTELSSSLSKCLAVFMSFVFTVASLVVGMATLPLKASTTILVTTSKFGRRKPLRVQSWRTESVQMLTSVSTADFADLAKHEVIDRKLHTNGMVFPCRLRALVWQPAY